MSDFAVVVPSVSATASAADRVAAELRDAWRVLATDVEQVLGAGWSGGAARAFGAAWVQWDAGARELLAALERLGELLAETARAYTGADVEGSADFARLALPGGSR